MRATHKQNFIKAVNFIYENCEKSTLNLSEVAANIEISTASLKRLFLEMVEISPGSFIRRLRMEHAFRSLQSKKESILEVALSSGFEDHSAFSRQFKKMFGYAPLKAREKLNILNELECITLEEPDFIETVDLTIQGITEKGRYFECAPKAWQELHQKLKVTELSDDFPGLFIGIGHDNGHEIDENQVRFTAGISLVDKDLGLTKITIPGCCYARFRYVGKVWNLGLAYHYIYGKWLENSEIKINNNIAAFIVFDKFPDGEQDVNVIIHVPILDQEQV